MDIHGDASRFAILCRMAFIKPKSNMIGPIELDSETVEPYMACPRSKW